MPYSAYVLTDEARAILLERCPPLHPEVIAHHVTFRFPDQEPPPPVSVVRVIGHASDHRVECVVVEVDGSNIRPAGGVYHVTLSLNRSLKAKPVHSNALIKVGWAPIEPFELSVTPTLVTP